MFTRKKLLLLSLFLANGLCLYSFITSKKPSSIENTYLINEQKNQLIAKLEKPKLADTILSKRYGDSKSKRKQDKLNTKNSISKILLTDKDKCPIYWNNDEDAGSQQNPLINLDRTKFLAFVPTNGPNNQLIGGRESIFVAIRLNRTIVLPTFYKHRSDCQISNGSYIHPGHRIDLEFLRRLVPVVTLDYFRNKCHGKIDAIFRVRKITTPKLRGLEKRLNMTVLKRDPKTGLISKDNPASRVKQYPLGVQLQKKLRYFSIFPEEEQIKNLYPGQEACAVFHSSFRNLKVQETKPAKKISTEIDLKKISSQELYSEVIRHTRTPRHIVALANIFVSQVMLGQPYLAVHWRFDRQDWMRRCLGDEPWASPGRLSLCKDVQSFKPIDIAKAIYERLQNISTSATVSTVYIAYPVVEKDVIQDAAVVLKNKFKCNVFTHEDMLHFWHQHYSSCLWLWPNRDDILSNTEMEVCVAATDFFRSSQSTWSSEVVLRRPLDPKYMEDNRKQGIATYIRIAKNKRESKKS